MGTTTVEGGEPLCQLEGASVNGGDEIDGCHVGGVYGSYLHGIFDTKECAQALVGALLQAKGLDPNDVEAVDMHEYKEQQYDKLADALRGSMDMDLIYKILEEGV